MAGRIYVRGLYRSFLSELDLLRLIDDQLNKYRREDEKERLLWGYLKKNMKGR